MKEQAVEKPSIPIPPHFFPECTGKNGAAYTLKQGQGLLYCIVMRHLSILQAPVEIREVRKRIDDMFDNSTLITEPLIEFLSLIC
jgi:hypothetical protein